MKYYKARIFLLFVAFGIVALIPVNTASAESGATANVSLTNSSAGMTQTGDTSWTLAKTGVVNKANSTVIWTITATEVATVAGHLVVNGTMTVFNSGLGGATIGNIVVNLQTRVANKWVTRSSDVADATSDDAATSANIVPSASSEHLSSFTENAASGSLHFMDAGTNTIFPLVPQVTIATGATVTLLFQASFDNNVLGLPVGTPARAEIILSFGNATANGKSAANIDINGNGIIDADENWVRSVASRLGLSVPAQVPGDATATLTDTLDDITTTGTVTFSNAQFNLGATGGTVTVSYDAGTDGGTITNCAHLTSNSLNLQACNTQTIGAHACTPGTAGCGWSPGQVITYTQPDWGDPAMAGSIVAGNYDNVYASTFGVLEVGIPGSTGFSISFLDYLAVLAYLPQPGAAGALTADLVNPTSSSAGVFGGEVVALQLNVDFSDASVTLGSTGIAVGDLRVCGTSIGNGLTIRDILDLSNTALGGGASISVITDLNTLLEQINGAFSNGNPTVFAQEHVVNGACPWKQGDMLTYPQGDWGDSPAASPAAALLDLRWDQVYAPTFGVLEVGIPGTSGFSLALGSSNATLAYLPAVGPAGALTSDLIDPTSSSSGFFGGDVVTLALNSDFSAAGFLPRVASFGSLNLCGVPGLPNMSINTYRGVANIVLGGGSSGYDLVFIATLTNAINAAFVGGTPSTFAQEHLVNGACP